MKNKKVIKVYELLNKINKDKNYRPVIKMYDCTYKYQYDRNCYKNINTDHYGLFNGYCIDLILDDTVEILDEENEEFEDILDCGPFRYEIIDNDDADIEKINANFSSYKEYIEQLIRNQKKIIERLNKDE